MFGLCKDTFPKEATIECIEKRGPGTIDIKIMATPCDGIVECRDGSDENCGEDRWILLITTTLLLLATICIYLHIVFIRLPNWKNSVFRDFDVATICSESQPSNFKEMKGNALAKLKVFHCIFYSIEPLRNMFLFFRMTRHKSNALKPWTKKDFSAKLSKEFQSKH